MGPNGLDDPPETFCWCTDSDDSSHIDVFHVVEVIFQPFMQLILASKCAMERTKMQQSGVSFTKRSEEGWEVLV